MAIVNKWINTRFFCSKPYKNGVITTSAPLKGGPLSMALQRLGNWGAKTLLMCMKYHPIYNDPWVPPCGLQIPKPTASSSSALDNWWLGDVSSWDKSA